VRCFRALLVWHYNNLRYTSTLYVCMYLYLVDVGYNLASDNGPLQARTWDDWRSIPTTSWRRRHGCGVWPAPLLALQLITRTLLIDTKCISHWITEDTRRLIEDCLFASIQWLSIIFINYYYYYYSLLRQMAANTDVVCHFHCLSLFSRISYKKLSYRRDSVRCGCRSPQPKSTLCPEKK